MSSPSQSVTDMEDGAEEAGEDKSEESDGEESAFGDFDSFLLGRDDINFICGSQGEVFTKSWTK